MLVIVRRVSHGYDGYMVWYIVSVYGMVHCWRIGYGILLAYRVWYIVDLYGTVHCWFLSKA